MTNILHKLELSKNERKALHEIAVALNKVSFGTMTKKRQKSYHWKHGTLTFMALLYFACVHVCVYVR